MGDDVIRRGRNKNCSTHIRGVKQGTKKIGWTDVKCVHVCDARRFVLFAVSVKIYNCLTEALRLLCSVSY